MFLRNTLFLLSRHCSSQPLGNQEPARFLFWISVKDASGGFRCYRVAKLRQIDFSKMRSKGYSFQQEMLYRCILKGAKVGETPIIFENRRDGVSKVNWWEALRSISLLVYLGLHSRISRDP